MKGRECTEEHKGRRGRDKDRRKEEGQEEGENKRRKRGVKIRKAEAREGRDEMKQREKTRDRK